MEIRELRQRIIEAQAALAAAAAALEDLEPPAPPAPAPAPRPDENRLIPVTEWPKHHQCTLGDARHLISQ